MRFGGQLLLLLSDVCWLVVGCWIGCVDKVPEEEIESF